MTDAGATDLITLTAELTAAHLSNNSVDPAQVPRLIRTIHAALARLGAVPESTTPSAMSAAVTARKSLASPEHIVSLIDGKPYRTLRRHLTRHGHTPESYRAAFNLPATYPMVAPGYSERRAAIARELGLGRKPEKAPEPVARTGIKAALASARSHLGNADKPRRTLKPSYGDDR